ncbi:hypothetical protein ACIPSA_47690 [Streptomyces sp. NPDC086549]|uniref:hypothetical protein n=1 Tax=Streptomyces sp. NPDC086549 TaxID=3365752 RepID=UPI00380A1F9E
MNRRRMIALTAAASAVAGVLLLAPASPASAATSCYGSAKTITGTDDNWHWPAGDPNYRYTTSYCDDINVKITTTVQVRTCFSPTSGDDYCNSYRTVYANTWGLAATDVKDGTKFWLVFNTSQVRGLVAY